MDESKRSQQGQNEGDEQARLRRPGKEIKDLETPAEASEQVHGGAIKGESRDGKHAGEIEVES